MKDKKDTSPSFGPVPFSPNFRYSSKCLADIYRAQCGVPPWYTNMVAENKQCKHLELILWLSRRLIISTDKTSIYITTFPPITNKMSAKN